jgi:TRAP-type C4-dicarboxylate transport system permease small subunit
MKKFLRKVTEIFRGTAMFFLFLLFASVFIQIVMRNMFNAGSIKLEELARFSLVSLVFLMIPVLTFDNQHIIVDILLLHMRTSMRKVVDFLIQIVCGGFGVFVLLAIATIMERNWSVKTPAIGMPNIIFYFPIASGMFFMVVGSIFNAFCLLGHKEAPQ